MSQVKVKRRIPSPKDLAQLLRFRKVILSPRRRRLTRALTIYDLREIAKRRTPQAPFDYTDGGADTESSLTRARAAYEKLEFQPRILRDVKDVDLSVQMLGKKMSMPVGIAPTGFTRMMQTEGEYAGACAASDAGIPYTLSTMGTRSIEDVAKAAPTGRNWFQLYMWKDRDRSMALVDRAKAAGFDTLVLTVDVPVAGARLRDVRNGMTIPPSLTSRTILNAIPRPAWWVNFLTTDPLKFASLDSWNGTVAELLDSMFDPTVTYDDLKWIRQQWKGNLVVKGIQNVDDAVKSIESGADAIILSNHGGRQLERGPVPLELLPEVVAAVGDKVEIYIDGAVLSGQDVYAAITLGAKAVFIGRAYLYGLMAGGKDGVQKVIEILERDLINTMALTGASSIAEGQKFGARIRSN